MFSSLSRSFFFPFYYKKRSKHSCVHHRSSAHFLCKPTHCRWHMAGRVKMGRWPVFFQTFQICNKFVKCTPSFGFKVQHVSLEFGPDEGLYKQNVLMWCHFKSLNSETWQTWRFCMFCFLMSSCCFYCTFNVICALQINVPNHEIEYASIFTYHHSLLHKSDPP